MGRHFSESEVSAMSRNKIEDKGLKERLFRLREEKTSTYENHAKERKMVMDLLKENRRTSGNTQVEFDEKEISEESFKNVLLSRRPWSCTPCETTFNVIYREASDPGLLKATYRLKDKGSKLVSRRASARSVPNGRRSLAVSRQSTRSEPLPQRPNSCFPGKTKTQIGSSRKFRQNDIKTNFTREQPPIQIQTKLKKPKQITAKWCLDRGVNDKTSEKLYSIRNETRSISPCNQKLSKEEQYKQSKLNETVQIFHSSAMVTDAHSENKAIPTIHVELPTMPTADTASTNMHAMDTEIILPKIDIASGVTMPTIDTSLDDVTGRTIYTQADVTESRIDALANTTIPAVDGNSRIKEINKSSFRPKSKIRKRLSIQEPNLNKITENNNISTEIYELNKSETSEIPLLHIGTHSNSPNAQANKAGDELLPIIIDEGLQDKSTIENGKDAGLSLNPVSHNDSPVITMERQLSRPSTVGLAESYEVVDFNSLQSDNQDSDYIIFKGRHIHNYVKPQLRYKHDPFAEKSRERLMRKLTTVTPVLLKEEKRVSAKSHRVYSKGARQRMLKELISENNSQSNKRSYNADNDKLESKIHNFYDSITEFCRQNTFS